MSLTIVAYETRDADHVPIFLESCKRANARVEVLKDRPRPTEQYTRFRESYFHLSPNSPAFELACFERYFAILDFMGASGLTKVIMSDTDVLVQACFSRTIESYAGNADVMLSAPVRSGELSRYLEMSPHFSLWTKDALASFVAFVVHCYATAQGQSMLQATAESNKKISPRSGVSDMTLCALWVKSDQPRFLNSTKILDCNTIDHNIGLASHAAVDQFEMSYGTKRFVRSEEGIYLFRARTGELVRPLALHFQGKYKMLMEDALEGRVVSRLVKSAAITSLRMVRRLQKG